ncbi:acyltransferase family protein [Niveibacterium sp. SC-1]|uniref:acyltransferase family protein n=1 Tax=Niveibacterium sp. SC-1 TaxID=3135646 RepID=UPI00311D3E46
MDRIKAIGIVLVVLGHAPGFDPRVTTFIYSFHMPLFFFVSGYVLSRARLDEPWWSYVRGRAGALLPPYVLFFVPSYAYWLLARNQGSHAGAQGILPWYDPLIGLLLGYGPALYVNTALWFFCGLLVSLALYHAICKRFGAGVALLVCALIAQAAVLVFPLRGVRLIWCMENACVAAFFVALGQWCASRHLDLKAAQHPKVSIPVLALALTATVVLCLINGRTDLNKLEFGLFPALYLPNAVVGIVTVALLARLMTDNRALAWLSANTLIIFPSHLLMFNVFTAVGVLVFGLPLDFKASSAWFGVIYAAAALLLSVPLAYALAKILPSVFGVGRPKAGPRSATLADIR